MDDEGNDGHANFPEYQNVYVEPCAYGAYKKTGVFPDGTIFYKELQLICLGEPGWLAHRAVVAGATSQALPLHPMKAAGAATADAAS